MDSTMQDAFSDDEDLYGNSESTQTQPTEQVLEDTSGQTTGTPQPAQPSSTVKSEQSENSSNDQAAGTAEQEKENDNAGAQPDRAESKEDEEEEEEEEESDSDIEFIVERKDGSRPEPPSTTNRYNKVQMAEPQSTSHHKGTTAAGNIPTPTLQNANATPIPQPAGSQRADSPVELKTKSTSKINIDNVPTVGGKPLTELSMETEIPSADKPWRKPGADQTDYFNYGFDEFTWSLYCMKQQNLREEYNPAKMWQDMMSIGGFPGMPGMMPDASAMVPAELQAMMAAAGGVFPDPNMFMGGPPIAPGPATGPAQMNQGRPQPNPGFDPANQPFNNPAALNPPSGPQGQTAPNMGQQTQAHAQQPPQQPRMPPQGPAALQQQQHHHQGGMPSYNSPGFDNTGMMPGPGMGPGGPQGGMVPPRPMGTGYGPNRGGARNVRPGASGGAAYQGLPY